MWLIGVPQFVSFCVCVCVCVCMCVCVCVCVWWGGQERRSGPKAPLFLYTTNIYRVLSSLAHLDNEPDFTMSFLQSLQRGARLIILFLGGCQFAYPLQIISIYMSSLPIFVCLNFILIIWFP